MGARKHSCDAAYKAGGKIIISLFSHTFVPENWDTRNTATCSSEPKHLAAEREALGINPTLFHAESSPAPPRRSPPARGVHPSAARGTASAARRSCGRGWRGTRGVFCRGWRGIQRLRIPNTPTVPHQGARSRCRAENEGMSGRTRPSAIIKATVFDEDDARSQNV